MEFREYTVEELVRLNMLEKPMDGNHGGKHPTSKDYVKKGIPFIMVSDINNGKINYNTCKYISKSTRNGLDKGFSKPNDVLLSHKATIGLTAIVGEEFEEIVLTPQITYYRVIKGINNRYLKYYFDSAYFQNILSSWATSGSTRAYLGITAQLKLPIILPDINIQNKIAKMLSDIDKKIELNNQINDNLHELAQVLFEEDLNKENLENYKLEDLFYQIAPGTNYQPKRVEDGIPFLNVKNINSGYIDFSDSKYISEEDYAKVHKTWQPEENDLLISRIGTLGLVAVIRKEDLPLAVHYNFLNLKTNKIPFEFGYFMLKSQYFQTKYKLNIKNSVQEYVTVDDIRKIEVDIPQLNDMEKYKVLYNKILNIQRENRFLTQLRDTLLPKLMNGEIDLDKIEI